MHPGILKYKNSGVRPPDSSLSPFFANSYKHVRYSYESFLHL
jgi:hypothetical protein